MKVDWPEKIDASVLQQPDGLLKALNLFFRSLTPGMRNGLSIGDNMNARIVTLGAVTVGNIKQPALTSGVEYAIKNPLSTKKPGFTPLYATDANGNAVSIASTKVNQSRPDGQLGITVTQDLQHTLPYLEKYLNADQSISNNTTTTILWDKTAGIRGSVISYSGGTFTVSEAGTYAVNFSVIWQQGAAYTYTQAFLLTTGSVLQTNAGGVNFQSPNFALPVTTTDGPMQQVSTQLQLTAGATIAARVFQTNGSAAARVARGVASNAVIPSYISIGRTYNDSTPTMLVTGVLWGG